MIVTEEEAKTKWCPNAPPVPVDASGNIRPHDATCIGSACMAWRWHRSRHWQGDTQLGNVLSPAAGYCGKAGRP